MSKTITEFILVASGGALGASLRYLSSIIFGHWGAGTVLFVNVLGCFLVIPAFKFLMVANQSPSHAFMFLVVGCLGSFTTFSAFSFETLNLYQQKSAGFAISYIAMTVIGCLGASYLAHRIFS